MKHLLSLTLILFTITINAQNYLINFSGAGASATVASVIVENLSSHEKLTINGTDVLSLNVLTSAYKPENSVPTGLRVFPNPLTDNSVVQFFSPVSGDATISIFDINGKQMTRIQNYFENSLHEFRVSGLKKGLYFISVSGHDFQYTGKLLSNYKNTGPVTLQKINSIADAEEILTKNNSKGSMITVEMQYTVGDKLKFTGISGIYTTIKTEIPTSDKTINFDFIACTDADNINYPVVEIGTQVWMADNLKTTKYLDGSLIGTTTPANLDVSSESTPKYQWAYNGNESNVETYGRLYSWYAITDSRSVCPTGWHVPTHSQWTTILSFLGGESIAGGKMKEPGTSHWLTPNNFATNESNFTGFSGGSKDENGVFSGFGNFGVWWSATESSTKIAWGTSLSWMNSVASRSYGRKQNGFSVRCLKD